MPKQTTLDKYNINLGLKSFEDNHPYIVFLIQLGVLGFILFWVCFCAWLWGNAFA